MTACVNINPLYVPVLLADTMVSVTGVAMDRIIPATIARADDKTAFFSTRLARKALILNDAISIAFAGELCAIKEFMESAAPHVDHILNEPLPMQRLSDLANDYGGRVSVVGAAHLGRENDYHKYNMLGPDPIATCDTLNDVRAIGSGGVRLSEMVMTMSGNMALRSPFQSLEPPLTEYLRGLISSVINSRLATEMGFNPPYCEDWGGFIEYTYFDLESLSWRRGPRSLHLFYGSQLDDNGKIQTGVLPHAIAYDPGGLHGRVLTVTIENGHSVLHQWYLENVLQAEHEPHAESPSFWQDWKPESATITVFSPAVEVEPRASHRSTEPWEMPQVIFDISETGAFFGLENEIAGNFMRPVCAMWGAEWQENL